MDFCLLPKIFVEILVRKYSEENIEEDKEIHRKRYISQEQRQKIIDDVRLI